MKYYTPKIEEFHVGFECEILDQSSTKLINDRKWHTISVSPNNNELGISVAFNRIPQLLKRNEIKVKYLDTEDIESLGWNDNIIKTDDNINIYYFKIKHDECGTEIKISVHKKGVRYFSAPQFYTIFNGILKNKSELRKLMQQLNIK